MKTSLPSLTLAALFASRLGLATITGGCASTATQSSTGEYVDDSAITVKVKAAFVNDPMVKVRDVSVETFKGVVQLSGFVDTAAEKAQAERVAASISGVTSVKNSIVVK
jgi:osmotically-inducible protein OsmY